MRIKAHVRDGRLVVDEPTDLPDGTEIEMLPLYPGYWLDEHESEADVAAGRLIDSIEILRELRSS